jgi:hypothetical protein
MYHRASDTLVDALRTLRAPPGVIRNARSKSIAADGLLARQRNRQKSKGNFARTYERRQALRKLRAPARVPLVRLPALQAGDARDDRQSEEDEIKLASGQLFDENFCLRLAQLEMQLRIAFLEYRQTSRRRESHTCGREEVTGVSTVE